MTYMTVCRLAAYMDSMALRGWAKAGKTPPKCVKSDYWDDWLRAQKVSSSSFRKAAA